MTSLASAARSAPAGQASFAVTANPRQTHQFETLGSWQPVRLLGRGRSTLVFQARPLAAPPHSPADYVVKTLHRDYAADPLAQAAIAREALVARELNHAHLPALLDAHTNRAPFFVVFPYQPAVSARRLIQVEQATTTAAVERQPRLAIPRALWIARQATTALAALHAAGWLHGDVKPDNLLVTPQGHTTLIDLGFARRIDSHECSSAEVLAGSCIYTPPEAILPQESLTAASDVYSLGVTLFELLTGRAPMETSDRATVVAWHLCGAAPDLRQHLPHAPLRLARLLRAMLARQPLRRPSVAELLAWLAELEIETLAMR